MLIIFLLSLVMVAAFFAGIIWSLGILAGVFKIAFFALVCFAIWKVLFS